MSLQMSSEREELHKGNTFDEDSSEATASSGPISVHNTVDDLFEEINRYRDHDQAMLVDLSN